MRHIYVKGVPHWTDGELTLPVMAGGQIDWTQFGAQATEEKPGTQPIPTLFNIINRWYWDPDRNMAGKLETYYTGAGANRKQKYRIVSEDGSRRIPIQKGSRLLDVQSRQLFTVGDRYDTGGGSRDFKMQASTASEADLERFFPQDGGGSYSSTQAAQSQAEAHDVALANLKFQQEQQLAAEAERRAEELETIRQENQLKRDKLSEAGLLTRNFLDNQQKTRNLIAELTGVDPVAGTVAAFGGVQRGTTQAQASMAQNKAFVNQAVPTVDENAAVPQIQAVIDQLNQNQPPVMPSIGFAGGGNFGYGPQFGTRKTATLVGEAGSQIAPGTEVAIDDPATGQTEIIPLTTGGLGSTGMDTGGIFGSPSTLGDIPEYSPDSYRGALSPLYGALGFSGNVPTATRDQFGFQFAPSTQGGQTISGATTAQRLGYRPRLIRDVSSGAVYYVNPQGQLQGIASPDVFKQSGFQWKDVLGVAPSEIAQFGTGGAPLTAPPPMIEQPGTGAQPLLSPPEAGNIPLPNLSALSQALVGMKRYLDPDVWTLISSIYGRAGLGMPQNALESIQQAVRRVTPTGSATRAGARLG